MATVWRRRAGFKQGMTQHREEISIDCECFLFCSVFFESRCAFRGKSLTSCQFGNSVGQEPLGAVPGLLLSLKDRLFTTDNCKRATTPSFLRFHARIQTEPSASL